MVNPNRYRQNSGAAIAPEDLVSKWFARR